MEAEKPGDTRDDPQALVDTLADSLPEVEIETLGDTLSDGQAPVERLTHTVAEVAA